MQATALCPAGAEGLSAPTVAHSHLMTLSMAWGQGAMPCGPRRQPQQLQRDVALRRGALEHRQQVKVSECSPVTAAYMKGQCCHSLRLLVGHAWLGPAKTA